MKTRHEGPIPEGKQLCHRCEGWGVTHYSAEEIGKPVTCSKCDGEGLEDSPPRVAYPTVDERFDEWLSARTLGLYTDEEEGLARAAWKAAEELYGYGD